jgi:hypothetical protein
MSAMTDAHDPRAPVKVRCRRKTPTPPRRCCYGVDTNHSPPPSYGGGAPSYGAEGEGPTDDLRKFQIWNRQTPRLGLSPSGPAGHLPRMTGEANEMTIVSTP